MYILYIIGKVQANKPKPIRKMQIQATGIKIPPVYPALSEAKEKKNAAEKSSGGVTSNVCRICIESLYG